MTNIKYFFVLEQVVTNTTNQLSYSLPSIIKDVGLLKQLIKTIDSDPELMFIVTGDASRPGSAEKTAKEVWQLLDKYPIGATLRETYPGIEKYRISGALNRSTYLKPEPNEDLESTEFYKFDLWANSSQRNSEETMPSFKEYINNPSKYNPQQVTGAATKTRPLQ